VYWNGSPVSGPDATTLRLYGNPFFSGSRWDASVGASGFYSSGSIIPDDYFIQLIGGSCNNAEGSDALGETTAAVAHGASTIVNFDMTLSAGLVAGTITRGGLPAQGVEVFINGGDCTTLVTDANGRFDGFFAPGNYIASTTTAESEDPIGSPFSVQAAETTDISALLSEATIGARCPNGDECAADLSCVDGVCCTSSCGDGADDCQACSIEAGGREDGTCTPLTTTPVCRDANGTCDVAERCGPTSTECPANGFIEAGTICGTSSGVCDVAGTCSGSDGACHNGYSPGTQCYDRNSLCQSIEDVLLCTDGSASCPAPTAWPTGACRAVGPGPQSINLLGGLGAVGGVTVTVTAASSPGGEMAAQGPGQFSPAEDPNRCPPATGFSVVKGGDDQTGQFWNIDTSDGWIATPATVCVRYSPDPNWVVDGFDECDLKLFHGANAPVTGPCTPSDAGWTSINVGGVTAVCPSSGLRCTATGTPGAPCQANTICGMVPDHFSPFAVFAPLPGSTPTVTVPANMVVAATSTAGATASFAAGAVDPIDGPLTPVCTPASGSAFPIGLSPVTCTATNSRGVTGSAIFTVSVQYEAPADGSFFLFPIRPDGSSLFRIGRPVPVRFRLTGASAGIKDLTATLTVNKISNAVQGTVEGASDETVDDTDMTFKYRPLLKFYAYRWKTRGETKGTYKLRADLGDGVVHEVKVSLR
jgi:hypothetical protein